MPHVLNVSLLHMHGGTPKVCLNYTKALTAQGSAVTALLRPDDPNIQKHRAAGAGVITTGWLGQRVPYNPFARYYCR